MSPRELRILLGLGSALTIGLILGLQTLLDRSMSVRLPRNVCLQANDANAACYAQAKQLTERKTTKIAVSPSGQHLASAVGQTVQLWNLETETLAKTLSGHTGWITTLAFSPDGRTLATGSMDETIKLWSIPNGTLLATLNTGRVTCLEFSPNGQSLAAGSRIRHWVDGKVSRASVQVWNLATQTIVAELGQRPVTALAFSPTGAQLAAGSTNTQIWQVAPKKLLHVLDSGDVTALVFEPDGRMLITGSSRIKIWNAASGTIAQSLESGASDLALSANGKVLLAAAGGTVHLWQLPKSYLGSLRGSLYSGISVAFGLNNQAIVSAGSDGIQIWRPQIDRPSPTSTSHVIRLGRSGSVKIERSRSVGTVAP